MTKKDEGMTVASEDVGDEQFKEIRDKVIELRDRSEITSWEMAEVLDKIYSQDLYRAWGYDSWRAYVEEEVDIKLRSVQYLVQLQKWLVTLPANVQKWIREIGWGKAKLLVRVVTKDNASVWRKRVEGKTFAEIEAMLVEERQRIENKESGGDGEGSSKPKEERFKFTATLTKSERDNLLSACQKAGDMAGTTSLGQQLDLLATEFKAANAGNQNPHDYLTQVERMVGFKLVAYDESTDEVVFGADLIDKLGEQVEAAEEAAKQAGNSTVQ